MLTRGSLVGRLKAGVSLSQIGGAEAVCALRKAAVEDSSKAVREEASKQGELLSKI
jgi:hypothetical protein